VKAAEAQRPRPGGKADERALDAEELELVNSCRKAIEAKSQKWAQFAPVCIRTQVVSGKNYFVKINVGGDNYIHVVIWRKANGQIEVTTVTPGMKKADPL